MGTTLTDKIVSDTYDGLIKVTDNNIITGTKKRLTDGFGNDLPILVSTTDFQVDGTLVLNGTTSQYVRGDGSIATLVDLVGLTSVGLTLGSTGTDANITGSPLTSNGSITLNLPTASATNRGLLSSANWSTFNSKESALTFSAPLSRSTNTISIPVATSSVNGYLSSANWTTFNNKQNAITLTTTGSSGASTFVTNTLNIPNYTLSGLGGVPTTRTLTINGTSFDLTADRTWTIPTITSIGISMPSAFSVTGSPLTSNGSISITGAGTALQYIDGTGSLQTFPTFLSSDKLITEVYNSTGATLTKGTVVYITGAQGNLPLVSKALATGDSTSAQTFGLVQNDITNMNNGYVIVSGKLTDIDTSLYTSGTQLYLSPTTAGTYTSTKPYAPSHLVYVGIVVRSHNIQGSIEVRVQNGFELDELHDVIAQTPANNDGIFYNSTSTKWENKSIATALGFTPVTNARTISTTAPLSGGGDLTANRTLSISQSNTTTNGFLSSTDWNTFNNKVATTRSISTTAPLSGGGDLSANRTLSISQANSTTNGFLTSTDWNTFNAKESALTFSSPLSRATNTISIPQATTSVSGFLSSTDWTTFNNKGNGSVTSVSALTLGTTGTDLSSSVANGTTTPVITLNVPTASASNRGALSSADWTTFNNKQAAITGGATTITTSNLTASRALVSDGSGKVAVATTTSTEIGFVNGVTSAIQTQLNAKAPLASPAFTGTPTSTTASFGTNTTQVATTAFVQQELASPFNRQTASYTLVLADRNKCVEMNVASANNLTIPLNSSVAFAIGTEICVLQYGAGQTSIVATAGVTTRSKLGYLKIANQYTGVTLKKVGTDEWYVIGNLTA